MGLRHTGHHDHDAELPTTYVDHEVVDSSGEHVGVVVVVVPDVRTLEPRCLVVESGVLKRAHFVPVRGSTTNEEGHIVVPYDKDMVAHASRANRDHVLTPDDERELAAHYGIE